MGQEIRDWQLTVQPLTTASGLAAAPPPPPRHVQLPAHIDGMLPHEPSRYALRARVDLAPELRGRDLVFALPSLPAIATLHANGALAEPLEVSSFDRFRRPGPQAWRVHAGTGTTLTLDIQVEHTWPMSGWIEGTPRIGTNPAGDSSFRSVAFTLTAGNALAVGTMWSAGFTYLILFLFAKVRAPSGASTPRHYGWFALQALCAAHYPLFLSGVTQVFGVWDTCLLAVSQPWAALAGLHFTYSAFGLGRPPRWPLVLATAAAVLGLCVHDPFLQLRTVAPLGCGVCLAIVFLHLALLGRVARQKEKRAIALILASSWVFVLAALTIDGGAFVGLGGYLQGYRIGAWALALVATAQSAALSREHIESLRRADGLNTTLAQRLAEIESLNADLRERIGERTREVRVAIERTSHVSIGPTVGGVVAGRYRVARLIGAGGMGRVFEVASVRDGRRLALKVVGDAPTGEALTRFTREAELASRVSHPNVVSIVDFDVGEDGLPFLVMDLVEGEPLEGHRARFGDVPWALGVIAQVANGLQAIHARGIVHRDLKPSNVLLSEGESLARITDFGISCAVPSSDEPITAPLRGLPERGAELTKTGLVLGTPSYMAPELAHGSRDATPAADVFSLAVLAYELLAGCRPFAEPAFVAAQRGERAFPATRLRELAPEVPAVLADLIDGALRCDPPLRPAARAFARACSGVPARAA